MSYYASDHDYASMMDEGDPHPPQWMLDHLAMNPSYCGWRAGDDYMTTRDGGWGQSFRFSSWRDYRDSWSPTLDDLNELANFYFEVYCDENGSLSFNVSLWMLHPRKGASRGLYVEGLTESDAAEARALIIQARERNAERFSKVKP